MSREIKFRAWDKNRNEWYLPYVFICEDGELFSDDVLKFNTPNKEITLSNDNLIIEQYTGLKDKNGKEIYEGHIVKTKLGDIQEIRFVKQNFEGSNLLTFIALSNKPPYFMGISDHDEIIGNIHENPELLEVKI